MVRMESARNLQSQFGVTASLGAGYGKGGGDAAFAVGQTIIVRFHTRIPKGSVISAATLSFNVVVKTTSTTQSSYHEVRGEATSDSQVLRPGVAEDLRPQTMAMVPWTCSWTANPPDTGTVMTYINVKPILDEILARADYIPGGYATFFIKCTNENGSDMSLRLNNIFAPSPTLTVDFTPPVTDERITFNRCENSELSSNLDDLGDDPTSGPNKVPGWGQNQFFGAFVDPAVNGGTIERDTSFTRLPGIPTLRFTCGTPPAAPVPFTGPMAALDKVQPGETFVFAGWVYLPNTIPTDSQFYVGDVYNSFYSIGGLPRGVWRPFASPPLLNSGAGTVVRWCAAGLKPFVAGMQFWISEPAFFISTVREMPFNGLTPDRSGGYVDHRSTLSRMASSRVWTPRRAMLVDGVVKKMPTWTRRADVSTPIMELSEPIRGNTPVSSLAPGTTVAGLPAGVTVSEL